MATCEFCNIEFKPPPGNIGRFCSKPCYNAYRAENPREFGDKRVEVSCEYCGKEFTNRRCDIKNTKHNYCSSTCSARWRSKALAEQKLKMTESGVPLTCLHCSKRYYDKPHRAATRKYCSAMCRDLARFGKPGHTNMRGRHGELNPNYKGKTTLVTSRKRALENFPARCIVCDFDVVVDVHHIVPRRHGGGNKLENLAVLCPNHHAMADRGMITQDELKRLVLAAIARKSDRQLPLNPELPSQPDTVEPAV
jgi:5-methylcytosine-specific restriction endonuclease McrA